MAWPAYVMEVIPFEGNGNGLLGNFNLTNVGAGATYQNEGDAKIGTQTMSVQAAHETLRFSTGPAGLVAALALKSSWTIEFWMKFALGNNPSVWNVPFGAPWYSQGVNTAGWSLQNHTTLQQMTINGINTSEAEPFVAGWHFLSVQWDDAANQAKFFKDGIQVGGTLAVNNNLFATLVVDFRIGDCALYGVTFHRDCRFDKLIISDVLRNGVETIEVPPSIAAGFSKDSFAGGRISKGGFR